MSIRWTTSGSLVAGAAAAIGSSACCVGPLLLVMLGIGGAWGARLVALEAYQPWFIAAALTFFGTAFYRLYRRAPAACAPGEVCAVPAVRRRQRVIFWVVSFMAIALMAFPLYAPFFY